MNGSGGHKRINSGSIRGAKAHLESLEHEFESVYRRLDDTQRKLSAGSSQVDGVALGFTDLLNLRTITIQFVGAHNAGKSTLINALLSADVMPTGLTEEEERTSVMVVVRHTPPSEVPGPVSLCLRPDTSPLSAASAVGTAEVRAALYRANAEARRLAELSMSADAEEGAGGSLSSRLLAQVPKYYLHARVPALSGLVRQPWEALVIDNPGFLDTIPRIAEIPLKALSVSSVVVLVIHGFQITAKMNLDCYKQAFEKDPAVFRDNRFIVVVSCYDVVADSLTVQKAKDTVVRDVRKAVDQQIHQDNVCVVCGKWALLARKCLVEGGGDVERFVRWALEHPSIPRGQGERELSGRDSPQQLARKLEELSWIASLEERLRFVVRRSPYAWCEVVHNSCLQSLEAVERGVKDKVIVEEERTKAFKGDIEAMERKLSVLRDAQTDLMDLRDRRQDSEVYKSLVTAYKKDIELKKVGERAKEAVGETYGDLDATFRAQGTWLRREFKAAMRRFIDEKISVKLVEVAKSIDCHNMHQVLLKSVQDLGGRETAILHRYQELLDTVDLTQRGRAVSTAHTGEPATQDDLIARMMQTMTLKCVVEDIDLPQLHLNIFTRIWMFFTELFGGDADPVTQPYRKAELAETVESLKKEILSKAEGYYSSPWVQAVFVKHFFERFSGAVTEVEKKTITSNSIQANIRIKREEIARKKNLLKQMEESFADLNNDLLGLNECKEKLSNLLKDIRRAMEGQEQPEHQETAENDRNELHPSFRGF